jgi:hypothetical protein
MAGHRDLKCGRGLLCLLKNLFGAKVSRLVCEYTGNVFKIWEVGD